MPCSIIGGMRLIFNYIRDTLLIVAMKAAVLMFTFNLIVNERFPNLSLSFGESFLLVLSASLILIGNFKAGVIDKLGSIEEAVKRGNDVRYGLGITNISNILDIRNKICGKPENVKEDADKEKES